MERDGETSTSATGQRTGAAYLIGLVVVLGSVLGWSRALRTLARTAARGAGKPATYASARPFDASRFILNALLVPALDTDAVPLRWVDPRPALRAGPGDERARQRSAAWSLAHLVPDAPFDLEWHADGVSALRQRPDRVSTATCSSPCIARTGDSARS